MKLRLTCEVGTDFADSYALQLGRYLAEFAWTHFVTLTTEKPRKVDWLLREFRNRYHRRLTKRASGPIPYFVAAETGVDSSRSHIHALLAGCERLHASVIGSVWSHGFTAVARYDDKRGAGYYLTKSLLLNEDNYDVSRRFPAKLAALALCSRRSTTQISIDLRTKQ
jgi:hypothetical protein